MDSGYKKGRGAQLNTANKFSSTSFVREFYEGIDLQEEIKFEQKVFLETPKNILSKNSSPDIPYNFSINPYQGCEHGCVYCYARNVHVFWGFSAGLDWETKIIAKKNAPQLLVKAFLSDSWKPQVVALSGNTDPYQPLERQMKITRSLLEVFLKYRNPVSVITKSSLIKRDIDLLKELAKYRLVKVMFSVTTLEEKLRRILEPRTTHAMKIMKTISDLAEADIPVGVMVGPIIPSINDHEIDTILKTAARHGAMAANYTMARFNGDVEDIFADWLRKNFPDRFDKVWNKVKSLHGGEVSDTRFGLRMHGEGKYAEAIRILFVASHKKYFPERGMLEFRIDLFRRKGMIPLLDPQ